MKQLLNQEGLYKMPPICANVTHLDIHHNFLESLYLHLPHLVSLNASFNKIKACTIKGPLIELHIGYNPLESLDIPDTVTVLNIKGTSIQPSWPHLHSLRCDDTVIALHHFPSLRVLNGSIVRIVDMDMQEKETLSCHMPLQQPLQAYMDDHISFKVLVDNMRLH